MKKRRVIRDAVAFVVAAWAKELTHDCLLRDYAAEWARASQPCKTLPAPEATGRRSMSIPLRLSEYIGTTQDQVYCREG